MNITVLFLSTLVRAALGATALLMASHATAQHTTQNTATKAAPAKAVKPVASSAIPAKAPAAKPPQAMLNPHQFEEFDVLVRYYLTRSFLPGATLHVERGDDRVSRAYGRMVHDVGSPSVTPETLYDVASLTKVIATAPAVMLLVEAGKLDLDQPVTRYLPDCKAVNATLRQLLTHTSGIPAGIPAEPAWQGKAEAYALACDTPPTHTAGTFFRYSDVGFILLGAIVEKVSGEPFENFVVKRVWQPLGMKGTFFSPLERGVDNARIAPTQRRLAEGESVGAPGGQAHNEKSLHPDLAPGQELRGVVHDPTVRRMGGAAGSAGAFSTTGDIARFARMMLAGGELDGIRVLKKETVAAMTRVQTSEAAYWRRGLGFDIDSPFSRPRGAILPVGSYGHTGFTGCVLWIDPFSKTFYIFLSNRVYPADQSNILTLYTQLGNAVSRAVLGFDFQNVPGAMKAKDPLPQG